MHIPDGFVSPQTYLPASLIALAAWRWALKTQGGLRAQLNEQTLPRLAMLTALAYAINLVMLPLPGGGSAHAIGVALLALLFGVRLAFLCYSLVLLLQSLLFGAGGITTLAINALIPGLLAALIAVGSYRLLQRLHQTAAVLIAAWLAVVVPAILIALILGLQPLIAHDAAGAPLFFPFGITITLPAIVIPHVFIGMAEAALTLLVWRYASSRHWLVEEQASVLPGELQAERPGN